LHREKPGQQTIANSIFKGLDMTKITQGIFLVAVALLVLSAVFKAPVAAGGGAVVMLVGLIYAFVVTKRDVERSQFSKL